MLMVPLHAAFSLGATEWQQQFASHFARFMASNPPPDYPDAQTLNWLHYFWLAGRFAVLANQYGRPDLVPPGLADYLRGRVHDHWAVRPAGTWAQRAFPGGIRERIAWKLTVQSVSRSYYRGFVDADLFTLAIGADLLTLDRFLEEPSSNADELREIVAVAKTVYEQRGVLQPGGGWLFQPGVMWDHPDYAYAGQTDMVAGMTIARVPGIAADASHSFRFPLWLRAYSEVTKGTGDAAFWAEILRRLEIQFTETVLVPPTSDFPAWRTNNYMDGWNGVYRWNYVTQGLNNGYGPFQLSGSFSLGLWTFLGTDRIRAAYRDMGSRFPLPPEVIDTYVGPNTSRDRHPLVTQPGNYFNGYRELLVRLASAIGGPATR
jgi:hypothetical protein